MGRPGQSCRPGDNCCIVRRFGYRLQVAAINCRVRGASENRIAVPPDQRDGGALDAGPLHGEARVGTARPELVTRRVGAQRDPRRTAAQAAARSLVPGGDQDRGPRREHGASTIRLPEVAVGVLRGHQVRQDAARLAASPELVGDLVDLMFTLLATTQRRGPGRRPSGRPGYPLQPTSISKGFPTAMLDAGLPRLRFHDLRHLSTSFLLRMGIPPLEVARIPGHSSAVTTTTI